MAEEDKSQDKSGGCDVCAIKFWTKDGLIGSAADYDYKTMCCSWYIPFMRKNRAEPPTFFSKDEKLPLLLALFLGFQHCLAMLAGIATSGGYLITNDTCFDFQFDPEMCNNKGWMISCAWLTSGLLTIIQVFRLKIKGTPWFLGTGLISVMGTSFTFLPIARTMVLQAIADAKETVCDLNEDGSINYTGKCCAKGDARNPSGFQMTCEGAGAEGYGDFLGTCLVACLVEVGLSMMPPKVIKMLFPPVVTGAAIMLIGGGLISSGIKYVGGGVFCGENTESKMPIDSFGTVPQLCFSDNGDVALSFGSPEYVGLAFSCIFFSILLQIFGSPFFKSTFIFWSLGFGCLVAIAGKDVDGDGEKESYYREDLVHHADPITFLWVERTFPLGFSAENFLPILIGFMISSAETIGDVEMTCVYSQIEDPKDVSSRVQGGLLADGVNSFLACLFGSPPNTTFSQNNGLIALTRCASRSAGFACGYWLIILGVFGEFGALFGSIPICVVGGVVLQMFSSVFVSGMRVATRDFTRRNQFILMLALGVGLGVAMEGHIFDWPGPYTFTRRNLAYDYGFWPEKHVCDTPNEGWVYTPRDVTTTTPSSCVTMNSTSSGLSEFECDGLGGAFGAPSSVTETVGDGKCHIIGFFPNGINNGNCCSEYNDGKKMWRKTVLMVLKTPYGIGFLIAFILNLIIPEDKIEETKTASPSATESVTTSSA